jgi:sulfite reductase (NADPH) flavoprotein alpha-component
MTQSSDHIYNRNHPYMASIKERYSLCKVGSQKDTQHVVIDLQGSGITYNVGDSIGIYAHHDPIIVEKTLHAMKATGEETVLDKHAEKAWRLRDFLISKVNISEISRKLLSEIMNRQTNPEKKAQLEALHKEDQKEALKQYLAERHLWDVLLEHHEITFPPQELCNLLMPLLPRLYSISSSQKVVGDEVHLTVAFLEYQSNGHERRGVCTHYLCNLAPLNQKILPVYIQPHHGFTLPEQHQTHIIMIGPGTGVAPFRAFMQERNMIAEGCGKNWLFFGERNRASNFFYEQFWQELENAGKLRLNVAFSRDQAHKIYVQHRMKEHGQELFRWLEEGAIFYVCGDAQRMAKDVEAALLQIIQEHGQMDEPTSRQYLKRLRSEKRYLRDVY